MLFRSLTSKHPINARIKQLTFLEVIFSLKNDAEIINAKIGDNPSNIDANERDALSVASLKQMVDNNRPLIPAPINIQRSFKSIFKDFLSNKNSKINNIIVEGINFNVKMEMELNPNSFNVLTKTPLEPHIIPDKIGKDTINFLFNSMTLFYKSFILIIWHIFFYKYLYMIKIRYEITFVCYKTKW